MSKLAIHGGKPIREKLFPAYNTIGDEEKQAVLDVLDSGNLSQFLGAWHDDFYGGPYVRSFEAQWAEMVGAKHGITINSNTSGLFAALGASGVGPGDEVIVSPYSMTASAIAPVIYGAVPVFADIDPDNFGLDPKSVAAKITPRTKVILLVHIFGNPAKTAEILELAKQHNLIVIEDCAQAPMAEYRGEKVGILGDMGVFSFNYHKHIHTGEGGIIVTNNDELAEKCRLVRNHGEAVVEAKGSPYDHIYGFNYRMPEMEAALGLAQMKKLPDLVDRRIENVAYLNEKLSQIDAFTLPAIEPGSKHVYYLQAIKYNAAAMGGLHRNRFIDAVKAEIPSAVLREFTPLMGCGYVKPLYLQPIYQKRAVRCSFNCERYTGNVSYDKGQCPVVENLYEAELFTHEYFRPGMSRSDLDDVAAAFFKVAEHHQALL